MYRLLNEDFICFQTDSASAYRVVCSHLKMVQNATYSNYLLFEITDGGCENVSIPDSPFKAVYDVHCYMALILGPLNVLLNGLSLKIFAHRVWKNSAMSSILKSLSIFEICFGFCLFLHTVTHILLERFISKVPSSASQIVELEHQRKFLVFLSFVHPFLVEPFSPFR